MCPDVVGLFCEGDKSASLQTCAVVSFAKEPYNNRSPVQQGLAKMLCCLVANELHNSKTLLQRCDACLFYLQKSPYNNRAPLQRFLQSCCGFSMAKALYKIMAPLQTSFKDVCKEQAWSCFGLRGIKIIVYIYKQIHTVIYVHIIIHNLKSCVSYVISKLVGSLYLQFSFATSPNVCRALLQKRPANCKKPKLHIPICNSNQKMSFSIKKQAGSAQTLVCVCARARARVCLCVCVCIGACVCVSA